MGAQDDRLYGVGLSSNDIQVNVRYISKWGGLDIWRKDGTYTFYDFHEITNTVSQGHFGEAPDAVISFDRETGKQITRMADGTVVTAAPTQDGDMTVTTQIPGRPRIQGPSRVVTDDQGRPTDVYLAGRKLTSTRSNNTTSMPWDSSTGSWRRTGHWSAIS